MRCCAFSGAKGRTLLGKDANTAEGHFYDKLLKVKDRMKVRHSVYFVLTCRLLLANGRQRGDSRRYVADMTQLTNRC
jgi:hypothetical protein